MAPLLPPNHRLTRSSSSSQLPGLPEDGMKGVIMVGGPSTDSWFRPLSLTVPKPLFPLAGHPMIYHHIRSLKRFPNILEILIIGFYEASLFEPFVKQVQEEFGVTVRYLQEPKSLGTGGGICYFKEEILKDDPKNVFVMYGDICSSFPLGRMLLAQHQAAGTLATILATHVSREQSINYGCLVKEEAEGSQVVRHYVEKPESFVSTLVSCGVYLLDSRVFSELPNLIAGSLDQAKPKAVRLEQDILVPLTAERKVSFFETQDFWCQVKTPNSAITANRLYLEDDFYRHPENVSLSTSFESVGTVFVDESAKVDSSARIGPNVSIIGDCTIEAGARIKDSIILPGTHIKANALVASSIIGWNSQIGQWCRIEGAPDATSASSDVITLNGVKMPSITVLGGSVEVADEKVIRNCIVLPHKDLHRSYQNEILL